MAGLPVADVSLSLSASSINLAIGDTISVTHTVTNNGPKDASITALSINIPAGLSYVSNTCSAKISGSTLLWQIGILAISATQNCSVILTMNDCGQHYYQANVSANEIDSNPNNNTQGININGPVRIVPSLNIFGLISLLLIVLFVAYRSRSITQ